MNRTRRWLAVAALILVMGGASAVPQGTLTVNQTLSATSLAVRPCQGTPATVTATLTLSGSQEVEPLDLVLVLDRSRSEDLRAIQEAAMGLLGTLNPAAGDRVAVVSFADTTRVEQALSDDFTAVRAAIAGLQGGRLTALGDGLAAALDELAAHGREGTVKAVVVLSDGGTTTGLDPRAQAERAGALGFPIYFVGIGAKADRSELSDLAERAGGRFFAQAGTQARLGVLRRLGRPLLAQFVEVVETLPDALRYAGSPEGVLAPRVRELPNGTTELFWTLETLVAGQRWQTSFALSGERAGTFPLAREGQVRYLDERGARRRLSLPLPELEVTGTPPPVASFEIAPETPKANQVIRFFDRSQTYGRAIASWKWDFGDGATSSEQNPVHVYRELGRYVVRLEVDAGSGCVATAERAFRLSEFLPGPEVAIVFDPQLLRPGRQIPFRVAPLVDVSACRWDFGDGTTSQDCETSHTYAQAGNYTVTLTVTFADGRTVTVSRLLTVAFPPSLEGGPTPEGGPPPGPPLTLVLSPETVRRDSAVSFRVETEGEGAQCRWDFGDGTDAEGLKVQHTYGAEGAFTVSVSCTFPDGRVSRAEREVQVIRPNVKPVAAFTFSPDRPRPRRPVTFDSTASQDEDGTIASWSWDFGDGQTSEAPNPVHTYERPGRYEVTLVVTDDVGAQSDPVRQTIQVGLPPGVFPELQPPQGPQVPDWMDFYLDGGVVTDEELDDAARRFANGSFVQGTRYRLTEADLRALSELHDLRLLTEKYLDPAAAEADGYVRVGPYVPGRGQHYVHEELLNEEDPPRFDRVPVLMYARDEDGSLSLAGVSYVAFDEEDAVLFGIDGWARVTPPGSDRPIFVLEVWIWLENPNGMFAPVNPRVK